MKTGKLYSKTKVRIPFEKMVTCVISLCKNTSGKISKDKDGISFHRFPRDQERRKKWELAVNRESNWSSTESSVVCSEHFDTGDFYLTENGLRRLSRDAVPSINISACQPAELTISRIPPVHINTTDTDEVIELKHKVRRLEVLAENRRRRLNSMWQRNKGLRDRVERMKNLISHLIKHNKLSNVKR